MREESEGEEIDGTPTDGFVEGRDVIFTDASLREAISSIGPIIKKALEGLTCDGVRAPWFTRP